MDSKTITSVSTLLIGVLILSLLVSILLALFRPSRQPTTVIIERPASNNYRGWWGYHGAGLPGWGDRKLPPPPHPMQPPPPHPMPPHPK